MTASSTLRLPSQPLRLAAAVFIAVITMATTLTAGAGPVAAQQQLSADDVAPDALVSLVYEDMLGRKPGAKGLEFWTGALTSGTSLTSVIEAFIDSREVAGAYEPSIRLYRAAFLRPPDHRGLSYWVRNVRAGTTGAQMAEVFATATEFRNRYGDLTDQQFVDRIYINVLGRKPDAKGSRHWVGQLAAGMTRGELLLSFSESVENIRKTSVSARMSLLSITLLRTIPDNADMDRWASWPSSMTTSQLIERVINSTQYKERLAKTFTTRYPLTGQYGPSNSAASKRPALAVKIDNVDRARPQVGLGLADVVYEEMVEGNLTRLIGIFHSQTPAAVGPVRSVRVSDFDVLAAYNYPLLAASGANPGVLRALNNAPVVNVNALTVNNYWRDSTRRAPHNLMTSPAGLWTHSPAGASAPPVMFNTGPTPTVGVPHNRGVTVNFGRATVRWHWDAADGVWRRTQNGKAHVDAAGRAIGAENVIVMVTRYSANAIDAQSPEAHTVGRWRAMVFTNGTLIDGFWQRDKATDPIEFVDANGNPITLSRGQTWIELAPPHTTSFK